MSSFMETWGRLSLQIRITIAIGITLILALTIGLGVWAYRGDYQVLFTDLSPRDASSMTSELDKMKMPYQLADGGKTILVQKESVYKTRLKLMGSDVPLHGAVGFEVFNNADFGMTEFVQKVNYQRAVQGELTRTILSIDDIQSARVHLAIPEQSLFKKAVTKPKASVTLTMKPGRIIAPDQIGGIQRLVAASVPEIMAEDVTVLDQRGVALTRMISADGGLNSTNLQLDSKRTTEDYLVKKVTEVLDRTFGTGEAVASVDVVLNLDQSKVTTEEVLPARVANPEGSPTGVVVRERQTTRDGNGGTATAGAGPLSRVAPPSSSSSLESDYQVGRRVEQVVTAAGSLKRMTIAVVVKKPMNDSQMEKLKEVVGLAVGFNSQRGDAVVVYSLDKFVTATPPDATVQAPVLKNPLEETPATSLVKADRDQNFPRLIAWLVGSILVVAFATYVIFSRRRNRRDDEVASLTGVEREKMLADIQKWIADGTKISPHLEGGRK